MVYTLLFHYFSSKKLFMTDLTVFKMYELLTDTHISLPLFTLVAHYSDCIPLNLLGKFTPLAVAICPAVERQVMEAVRPAQVPDG